MRLDKTAMSYRKPYAEEYKKRAVRMIHSSGKSIKQVSLELGISGSALGAWKKKYARPQDLPESSAEATKEELQREIRRLKQELAYVTEQREALKKAAAILGQ